MPIQFLVETTRLDRPARLADGLELERAPVRLQKHPGCLRAVGVLCGVETCAPEVSQNRDPSFGFPAPAWCAGFGYIERHATRKEKGIAHEAKLMPRTDLTSRHRVTLLSASPPPRTGQLDGKTMTTTLVMNQIFCLKRPGKHLSRVRLALFTFYRSDDDVRVLATQDVGLMACAGHPVGDGHLRRSDSLGTVLSGRQCHVAARLSPLENATPQPVPVHGR